MKSYNLVFIFFLLFACVAKSGNLYKWTDKEGKVHISDTIPSSVAVGGYDIINQDGKVIDKIERVKSARELELDNQNKLKQVDQQRTANIQKRRDQQILSLYTTEHDITERKTNQLNIINQSISILEKNIDSNKLVIEKYEAQIADYNSKNKPIPLELTNDYNTIKKDIKYRTEKIDSMKLEYKNIEKRFEEDLIRFKQLKKQ
ncbi:MAG: DUF4124 domain-containing protein [Methylacidiphilales bacterium]|nr:DUF4124 domain-containing protein [Candidatus Methylacidiphilales bacterium]